MRSSLRLLSFSICVCCFAACGSCGSKNNASNNQTTAPNNTSGTSNGSNNGTTTTTNNASNNNSTNNGTTPPPCETNRFVGTVNFKRGRRLGNDMAQALGLDEAALCKELGQFDCVDFVHRVTLGDPEPYASGMYAPLSTTTTSTTLVVERIAMAGCTQRADADLGDPSNALIFKGIASGTLDPTSPEVGAAITTLYRRALLRDPTDAEVQIIGGFYSDVVASAPADPARDWAVLSCFAVLTSTESVFY